MARSMIRSLAAGALLLAAAPSLALTISIVPTEPVERTPFTLAVGSTAGCPVLSSIQIQGRTVVVRIDEACPLAQKPSLLEVPMPPLEHGTWNLQVFLGILGKALKVQVKRVPFAVAVEPPTPQAGEPFAVLVTGSADCYDLDKTAAVDGHLLTLTLEIDCILPSSFSLPSPFVLKRGLGPLPAGDYAVQVIDRSAGIPLASQRFQVSSPSACTPSETALCLLQGRYRVEATWRTATAQGVARAHPESEGFGAFWLSDPDSLVLFVELVDACVTPDRTVRVSTSGLTNAEVEVTVTEVASGEVRRYHNPLGMRFVPISDLTAFACPPPANSS